MRMRNVYVVYGTDRGSTYMIAAFSNMKKAMDFMWKYQKGIANFLGAKYGYGITRLKINDESFGIKANCRMQEKEVEI